MNIGVFFILSLLGTDESKLGRRIDIYSYNTLLSEAMLPYRSFSNELQAKANNES